MDVLVYGEQTAVFFDYAALRTQINIWALRAIWPFCDPDKKTFFVYDNSSH
jgi:hypothetical protein